MTNEERPAAPRPTPGWYDNGSGFQQWWDGTQWSSPPPAVPRKQFPLWAKIAIPLAAIVVVALVVVIAVIVMPAVGESHDRSLAAQSCRAKTMAQLKAPSTAKFGTIKPVPLSEALNASLKDKGEKQTARPPKDGSKPYIMSTHVDSQNSFGAMVRDNVSCIITVKDGRVKSGAAIVTDPNN